MERAGDLVEEADRLLNEESFISIVNIAAFILYGIDKHKAKAHQWRISEVSLLCIAVIGGSAGALLGMFVFRHKTKHLKFLIGVPLILVLQVAAGFYLIL